LIGIIILIFLVNEYNLRRTFIFVYSASLTILIVTQKYILRKYLNYVRSKGRNIRNLLIIGAGEVGQNFYESIKNNPHYGYRLIGFLDDSKKELLNGKYLGKIEILETLFDKMRIDEVIVALPNYAIEKLEWVMATCNRHTTRVKIIPDYFKFLSERFEISTFGRFPVISVRTDKLNEFHWRLIKRAFDTIFSLLLFIFIFSWLFPIIALIIKLTSPGKVFFMQERWGRNNKKFYAYKFRSMKDGLKDVDENGKYLQAKKEDPRITKIGKILRKTNLDELPQFINVLKGEMSIVGPRPHPTPLNLESKEKIRYYMLRHLVKPGITGWAQINGCRGETETEEKMQRRVDHDLWYIENWSFWLDIQIIILTIWNMLKGDKHAY
jgi:putative colanic acid biosynthesis UDP-glucose lipid carrier transferase